MWLSDCGGAQTEITGLCRASFSRLSRLPSEKSNRRRLARSSTRSANSVSEPRAKRPLSSAPIVAAAKVVDASAVAAILFGEPGGEAAARRLEGARLVAPGLLGFELANVCVTKCRRHRHQREALLAAFALRRRLSIEEVAVDHAGVLEVALTTKLMAYDASYLWLARELGAELVTLDDALERAAATLTRRG
jgi:predicted nucleic acid-binding protein